MRMVQLALPLLLALFVSCAHAEDKGQAAPKGTEGVWQGSLVAAPDGTGAIGSLKVKSEKTTLVLWCDNKSVVEQIQKLVKERVDAEVTGVILPDNKNVKVSAIKKLEKKK